MAGMRIEVYREETKGDRPGLYRWRAIARNGRIVADGSEGYKTKGNARRAAEGARFVMKNAIITEP